MNIDEFNEQIKEFIEEKDVKRVRPHNDLTRKLHQMGFKSSKNHEKWNFWEKDFSIKKIVAVSPEMASYEEVPFSIRIDEGFIDKKILYRITMNCYNPFRTITSCDMEMKDFEKKLFSFFNLMNNL